MSGGAANTLWARAFVDELARLGVREVAVAPGSRSTPLVLALAGDGRFRVRVHLDERSAAFFALGVGKGSRFPGVVVTTSGSAVANLLPAVVEAHQGETPLLVLTADRPTRLLGADANQAIDQTRIFGDYVRAHFEAGSPTAGDHELRRLRGLACRAVDLASGPPAGAVHVNFPFDKPLEPQEPREPRPGADVREGGAVARDGRPDGRPFVAVSRGGRAPAPEVLDDLGGVWAESRGLVIAGPSGDPDRVGPEVLRFAARMGWPVLADPLSGARFGPDHGALRVAAYDFLLRSPDVRAALHPSAVLRVGASPTSAVLQQWLAGLRDVPYIVLDEGGRWKDHGASATGYVTGDPAAVLRSLEAGHSPGGHANVARRAPPGEARAAGSWLLAWRRADGAAREVLTGIEDEEGPVHEGTVWPRLARALPHGTVFVSSSMPVRDLDAFAVPDDRAWRVLGNRGASGIDGIVSTAYGAAATRSEPVVCVLGDIAFFHDQNGLLWSREEDLSVVFVLVDNDGGGIFHMLPIAEYEPHFTRYFATPHGLDFSHAAAMHGLELRDVVPATIEGEVAAAVRRRGSVVLRLRTDRAAARLRRAEIASLVTESVAAALRSG